MGKFDIPHQIFYPYIEREFLEFARNISGSA